VVITDGALNLVNKESIRVNSQRILETTGRLKERVIGILIGGSTKDFIMDKEAMGLLLDSVIKLSSDYDCHILLTTSRRTPKEIEALIKKRLGNEPRCKLLVIANENNITGAVEGILGLSNIALVSEESISMISEAATSGCHTLVFRQRPATSNQKPENKRHKAFLDNLSKENFIELAEVENIYSSASNVFDTNPRQGALNDSSKIEEALERLL
jgi:mitochondrial fission protein ELM1